MGKRLSAEDDVMTHPMLEFFSRCLDEDERIARAAQRATDGRWVHHTEGGNPHLITRQSDKFHNDVVVYDEGSPNDDEADHIALHDPRSVLADVAAKRAILELHSPDDPIAGSCKVCEGDAWSGRAWWPCNTVRLLVSAYAHRPGYREEWKPS